MDASTKFAQTLALVTTQLLRPLVRVLLRNGMSFNAFSDLARRVYVDVGMNEFEIPGKKQTISRVAILSGLSRKEVQRLLEEQHGAAKTEAQERYNRAARVIAGWVRDKDFTDTAGQPLALNPEGDSAGFGLLVKRYSGDVPARAILDELLRVGAVERLEDDRIRLLSRAYIPRTSDLDKLEILGTDVSDLIYTIDHNLQHGTADPFFQRKVMYDNLTAEAVKHFRHLSAEQAQALLEKMDEWLSKHDRDVNSSVQGMGRLRAGIGIYYFEENLERQPEEK
ncbi:MAG: DUF6502 family protein [Sulfuricaulis sp.]|uniref:DUF6502 family protein n=1 Tax=Sulfuricaulis sp. TaxID=2003553 RepID=UPI0034A5834B